MAKCWRHGLRLMYPDPGQRGDQWGGMRLQSPPGTLSLIETELRCFFKGGRAESPAGKPLTQHFLPTFFGDRCDGI